MLFEFYPLRFEFVAIESLYFPPGKAANILRGALGTIFRRIACIPQCPGAAGCDMRQSCPYARIFEPSSGSAGPSGLADSPRPFVFRARHLDGRTVGPGMPFHFDLHLFSLAHDVLGYFIQTFKELAREGLGPRRGKAELQCVSTIPVADEPAQSLYSIRRPMLEASVRPAVLDLSPRPMAPKLIRIDFLSPTELKHEHKIVSRPEFPVLLARIRDRISALRRLYGPGALEIDFQAISTRAAEIRMTRCEMRYEEVERRSSRTGQTHSIGGFVGIAEYEGDFAEFLPYLETAKWTGVGRQAVWGKGEIEITRGLDEAAILPEE